MILVTLDVSLAFTVAGSLIGLILGNCITLTIIKNRGKHDKKHK